MFKEYLMVRTQIQLTNQQSQRLKTISMAENVSIAELIRQSIDLYLRTMPYRPRDELKQKALSIVGKYASEVDDVSLNHDDYLADIFYAEVSS